MAIDREALLTMSESDVHSDYVSMEARGYALGVGLGWPEASAAERAFTEGPELAIMPTLACITGRREVRSALDLFNHDGMVWGEQRLTLHRPLPQAAEIVSDARVVEVVDKGADKGALIYFESDTRLRETGEPLFTSGSTIVAQRDGGFGGPPKGGPPAHKVPDRTPDKVISYAINLLEASLYWGACDRNAHYLEPRVALEGRYNGVHHVPSPFGYACRAVLEGFCDFDPGALKHIECRFTSRAGPGDTLEFSLWRDGETVSFRSRIADRDDVNINNGRALLIA